VIGDEAGRVLGEGQAGPCNHVGASERRAKFFSAVGESVQRAARAAGVEPVFTAVCAGFSGGAADKDALTRELIRAEHYYITHDAEIALCGATAGGPGIIVIAGTGSIAYGRDSQGRTARAGGWGYIYGDEGGAFDIARQAIRAALRQEEGWGPPTLLRDSLLQASGCASANELLHQCYTDAYPRERVAQFASLVDEAAMQGDAVASVLLDHAGQELAGIGSAVRRALFEAAQKVSVHPIGGTWNSQRLHARFQLLMELDGATTVAPPRHGPAYGALLEAIRRTDESS
jgi:N-acetylglucosamine kinase-like BadF-type ATPase